MRITKVEFMTLTKARLCGSGDEHRVYITGTVGEKVVQFHDCVVDEDVGNKLVCDLLLESGAVFRRVIDGVVVADSWWKPAIEWTDGVKRQFDGKQTSEAEWRKSV